jgi:hypothetical protein
MHGIYRTRLVRVVLIALVSGFGERLMADADYGQELTCLRTIEKPVVMDTVVVGDHLYFVGRGALYIADIADPANPRVVGECSFRGAGRQLVVANGIAYVTARADGVHIFDVRDPHAPKLLCHYDCIELATGVEVQGNLLFIAQRQFGVEIVDVTDPSQPVHLSKIKTGEAQSIDVRGRYVYAGDWGVSELTTIDIADPYQPSIVSSYRMDGFGDGICLAGDYLYASTGHHNRKRGAFAKEGDPGYGEGHGLEIFSLKQPGAPEFLGRVEFPNLYHRGGYDMWTPVPAGPGRVCCADTFNGVFVVDVSDPKAPRSLARYHDLVSGVAVVDDYIYAACPKAGLRVLSAPSLVHRVERDKAPAEPVPPRPKDTAKDHRVYRPGGQVWSVDFCDDYAVVAAGMKGLRIVRLWPDIREVSHVESEGFAVHASVSGNRVLLSENTAGFSIWEHMGGGQLRLLGRYLPPNGESVRQAMPYADGKYAVLQIGNRFHVLDISDPTNPREVAKHQAGIIYGDQMAHGDIAGRYTCVWCHVTGVRWLDFAATGQAIDTGIDLTDILSFFSGIVSLGDQLLITERGGYRLAKPLDTNFQDKPLYRFDKYFLGKPTVAGHGLFLTSRVGSAIAIVDITDLEKPRLLHRLSTRGNPSTVVIRNGAMIVPDSYNGLLIYDNVVDTLKLDVDRETFLAPR